MGGNSVLVDYWWFSSSTSETLEQGVYWDDLYFGVPVPVIVLPSFSLMGELVTKEAVVMQESYQEKVSS